MDLFSWAKITVRAQMFERYATFSSGANHDPRACHGIWKKCCPAFETLDLAWLPRGSVAVGEVFVGKQKFEVFPRFWLWMFSQIDYSFVGWL
jgi:hypothetical protein